MHLVCGEALYDIFIDGESASENDAVALQAVSGGSPYNVAVGLARLGTKVAFATDVASDGLGERLARRMSAEGISDRFIKRSAPTTALAFVTVQEDGAPSYSFSGLHEATFAPGIPEVVAELSEISNLHLGSIALVLPRSAGTLLELAREVSQSRLVSLDPNVRLAVEPDPARWRDVIESLRPFAHVVKVSEEDIILTYGEETDPEQICASWLSGRTELVALTRGEAGAKLFTKNRGAVSVAAISTSVIDTVGAGDSFMAALLARLSRNGPVAPATIAGLSMEELEDLGVFAAAAAALTCSGRGPALPRLPEVERLAAQVRQGR